VIGMARRTGETEIFTATARREGNFWAITVDGLPRVHSHVWQLNQAEPMIRQAIACNLDVPDFTFNVRVQEK
jgi:hypothetical protein